jgi:hypothetical protein
MNGGKDVEDGAHGLIKGVDTALAEGTEDNEETPHQNSQSVPS